MQRRNTTEKLINWLAAKFIFATLVAMILVFSQSHVSPDKSVVFVAQPFKVSFSKFSPAFAAFEDEYLFSEMDQAESYSLKPSQEAKTFEKLARIESNSPAKTLVTSTQETKQTKISFANLLSKFDGEKAVSEIKLSVATPTTKTANKMLAKNDEVQTAGEFAFGSLAGMVKGHQPVIQAQPSQRASNPSVVSEKHTPTQTDFESKAKEKPEASEHDSYKVVGGIQLKEGLAFLGSMEVSWVVGDYELQRGSINTPDAVYEIEVNKLIGDVIISLYDNQDELIGEGLLDLTQATPNGDTIKADIQILPIDWDVAGQVVHADSLGSGVRKPVNGVDIALYSFNEATQSNENGTFSFFNWKKTNSRTLAIASKEGFFDSIFTLDSKSEAQVLLFENKYMNAFFTYLQDLGIYNVKEQGTVYGKIQGVSHLDGYTVKLDKARPLYFMTAGFATLNRKNTSANGLFSFVGLQDGDYELIVEKEGEVLDERLVVVEQGKVSPVIVDLSKVSKHLEFFDPMDPDYPLKKVEVSFFDGSSTRGLDDENQIRQTLNQGQDLSLMEFKGNDQINRTLLSRHKGLQKIPLVNDKKLLELANSHDLSVESGLVFGFVDSQEPYQVFLAEEAVGKTLYFDDSGRLMDADDPRPPRGFILGDFSVGLSSVIVERKKDGLIVGTDLIYSNHESISITHLEILPSP